MTHNQARQEVAASKSTHKYYGPWLDNTTLHLA